MEKSEAEGAGEEVVPKDEEHDNDGNGYARVQATTVRVSLLEVLGKLAAVGLNVWLVGGCLAALYLFLAFRFFHEAVEFVLTFGSVYMYATKATWFTA